MTILENKIQKIKSLLYEADKELNTIDSEGFDKSFPRIKNLLRESQEHKNYLLQNHSKSELMIYNLELTNLIKQIKKKFDNIIERKRLELEGISSQMKNIQNKKKLVNYIR